MPARTLLATVAAFVLLGAPASAAPSQSSLRLGTVRLHRCEDGPRWWCGALPRPLDPARPKGPRIDIGFRWLPPRHDAGHPALVAVEGGPGYPSTGSRYEYMGIYGPLLRERGLLLVDNRGTGSSALIDCRSVQGFGGVTSGPEFPGVVAACARQIERRYRRAGRPALHAADLFATVYATRDLAAVLRALRLGKVDLYGDSYGTYFVQSFISRYQRHLHSVVLDSAYPVRGLDPWYASSGDVARRALDAVCERDAGCAAAAPGSATARLAQLLARLRLGPIGGTTRDSDGTRVRLRFGIRALVDMVQDAASDPVIYRELDASVRAALAGDDAPLLRLVAQSKTYNHGPSTADYYSNGLYFAVSCLDYPQLFSMRASPAERRAQLAARLAAPPPGAFDPFTASEWLTMSAYSEPYRACLDWPRPRHDTAVVPAKPRPLPASIPMLIVGGDLDSLTPLSDAKVFGPTLARRTRVITLRNSTHVTSEDYTPLTVGADCAQRLIRAYVRAPAKLASLDARCARRIPPVHTPGAYPLRLSDALPAALSGGADPGLQARRAATVAANALADATIRRFYSGAASGPGLRGGSFTARGDEPTRFRLRGVRFVRDALVRGRGSWRLSDGAVRGTLVVVLENDDEVRVRVSWSQRSRLARATIGAARLTLPAP